MKPTYKNILQEEKGYRIFTIPKVNLPRYQNPPPPPNTCVRNWDYLNQKWMKPVHSNRCYGNCKNIAYRLTEEMLPKKPSKLTKFIPFMKILILAGLLTLFTCSSQPKSEKTIVTGTVYKWRIVEAVYSEPVVYFTWEFANSSIGTKSSNSILKGYVNFYYMWNLQDFASMLEEYSTLPTNYALDYQYSGFSLHTLSTNNYIYITDYDGCTFRMSKTNARKLAAEINKNLYLLEANKDEK